MVSGSYVTYKHTWITYAFERLPDAITIKEQADMEPEEGQERKMEPSNILRCGTNQFSD